MDKRIGIGIGAVVIGAGLWWFATQGTRGGVEIEYRYAPVKMGELFLSRSSTGVLVPLTTVDVKSQAGGRVDYLAVEEGTVVAKGDLVAEIDPEDTRALYEQAAADMESAQSRVDSAMTNRKLTEDSTANAVKNAEIGVRQAEIALERAREQYRREPALVRSALDTARAGVTAQEEALRQLQEVTIPQRREDAATSVRSAKTSMDNALAEFERQKSLYELGYAAKNAVERAESSYESAKAAHAVAEERLRTLDNSFATEIKSAKARVAQAQAALVQAQANSNSVTLSEQAVRTAERQLDAAKVALKRAQDDRLTVRARALDVTNARASAVRTKVSMRNAQEQLNRTRVLAPRDGVVTRKYIEEGTVVPPGASAFSDGTAIVQVADVTRMFVECPVDEADIASVKIGQKVRVIVEAYPGQRFEGRVQKVFPAATTDNGLTAITVKVEILDVGKVDAQTPLRPGLNATCEFVLEEKPMVMIVPQQAIEEEDGKSFVLVKRGEGQEPERRDVEVGAKGNDNIEILSGLKEGEEVVIAKIDLAAMREREELIKQREAGGGLTGGGG